MQNKIRFLKSNMRTNKPAMAATRTMQAQESDNANKKQTQIAKQWSLYTAGPTQCSIASDHFGPELPSRATQMQC
jgi:hypothetical protein